MKIPVSLLSVLLMSLSSAVMADKVYRWVDENGQTHFSGQPPAQGGKKAEEYKLQVQRPAAGVDGYRISTEKPAEQPTPEVVTGPKISKEEALAGCNRAKEYKASLSSNYNRRFKQEDGEYRPFTDEQRAAELKKADELIAHYCGNA